MAELEAAAGEDEAEDEDDKDPEKPPYLDGTAFGCRLLCTIDVQRLPRLCSHPVCCRSGDDNDDAAGGCPRLSRPAMVK